MIFFSGFSLRDEQILFEPYLDHHDFTVAGFSVGAIDAFEYLSSTKERVDKLQLFSPAFFQDKDEKYKRLQLLHFQKNKSGYCEAFLKNIAEPNSRDMHAFYHDAGYERLDYLLHYQWNEKAFECILERGIVIEVYLGEKDKIIDSEKARIFFKEFATVYFIKNAGHILEEG